MNKNYELIFKRFFDITISSLLILILIPFLLFLAMLIKLDSPGKAIFKQIRIGKNGEPFTIYKFRTMYEGSNIPAKLNDENNISDFVFQNKNDSRITKLGSFLRKTSLDELPQLFNVLVGNMSLVGPRPEVPEIVEKYPEDYKRRLTVAPGITGLAQINGRSALTLAETIEYDLEYIDNFCTYEDFKILCFTFIYVLKGDNAY